MTERVFEVDGLALTGGVVDHPAAKATVILCHGIPSGGLDDPSDAGYPGLAEQISNAGYRAVWFNFRGARDSEGIFTYAGWMKDLAGVIDLVADDLSLFVVGSSTGGAIALNHGESDPSVAGVATLASPAFWKRDDSLFVHCRNIGLIPDDRAIDEEQWWSELEMWPPEESASRLGRPLLVVQGTADPIVPATHAERIYERASEPKELLMLEDGGHQLRRDPRAVEGILRWLDSLAEPG